MGQINAKKEGLMKFMPRLKIYSGSNRKNTFNAETFEGRSYQHWLYVCKIKGKVIFNDTNYSVTTSKHQNEMKSFLTSEMGIKFDDIIFVDQRESLTSGILLDSFYETLALAEIKAAYKGRAANFINEQKELVKSTKAKIKQLKNLGATTSVSLEDIKEQVQRDETARLASNREKSQANAIKRKELVKNHSAKMNSLDAISI